VSPREEEDIELDKSNDIVKSLLAARITRRRQSGWHMQDTRNNFFIIFLAKTKKPLGLNNIRKQIMLKLQPNP
jgi:hypothetical protein